MCYTDSDTHTHNTPDYLVFLSIWVPCHPRKTKDTHATHRYLHPKRKAKRETQEAFRWRRVVPLRHRQRQQALAHGLSFWPEVKTFEFRRVYIVPVLERHGISPSSERGRRIIRYVEEKRPDNPGGYLQKMLSDKPFFDPWTDGIVEQAESGPTEIGSVLQSLGFNSNK